MKKLYKDVKKNIKLITYAGAFVYEDKFENLNQLREYVKTCGGFKALGDYDIYTEDEKYRYDTTLDRWILL